MPEGQFMSRPAQFTTVGQFMHRKVQFIFLISFTTGAAADLTFYYLFAFAVRANLVAVHTLIRGGGTFFTLHLAYAVALYTFAVSTAGGTFDFFAVEINFSGSFTVGAYAFAVAVRTANRVVDGAAANRANQLAASFTGGAGVKALTVTLFTKRCVGVNRQIHRSYKVARGGLFGRGYRGKVRKRVAEFYNRRTVNRIGGQKLVDQVFHLVTHILDVKRTRGSS